MRDPDLQTGVEADVDGAVLTLTINRPDRGNALRQQDCEELIAHLNGIDGGGDVRAILIRSEGKNFCAGADLVSANSGDARPRVGHLTRSLATGAHGLVSAVYNSPVPTVSAVQGKAMGLGLHIVAASDFAIAAAGASFTEPFCKRGFSADSGATFLLPSLIGQRRARQMLLRGISVDAETAAQWGLVDDVVGAEALERAARELAEELAQGPTYSLTHIKRLLNGNGGLDAALAREANSVEVTVRSADFKEGLKAFAERREPAFTGN